MTRYALIITEHADGRTTYNVRHAHRDEPDHEQNFIGRTEFVIIVDSIDEAREWIKADRAH